jgi:hypothetical protein
MTLMSTPRHPSTTNGPVLAVLHRHRPERGADGNVLDLNPRVSVAARRD